METPEQYTVKTPEKFTIVGITETTILNEDGQVIFDASCIEHTGLTDFQYAKKVTALFASAPELIKENERLRGTIGVECVKQLSELKKALAELLRFESSMRYATTNSLNEPDNFNKALDKVIELLQPKKDENKN